MTGRDKPPEGSGPDHPEGRRDVGRKKSQGKGAKTGRIVWPEGPEMKLNTRLWRDRPAFSSPLPFPSLFPSLLSLNPQDGAPRRSREGPRGGERNCTKREPGAREGEGRGAASRSEPKGHARPPGAFSALLVSTHLQASPQAPGPCPSFAFSWLLWLCGLFLRSQRHLGAAPSSGGTERCA